MEDASPKPQRLTLSRIVEMLATRSSDHSTVSLADDGKGRTKISVNVRSGEHAEHVTLADATAAAVETYNELRALYPPAPEADDADVTLTRNAKGENQISVKVATADGSTVLTADDARDRAGDLYETLRGRFPLNSGAVSA